MTRIVSFIVLLAILIIVGVLSFEVLSSFLLPLFIALLLVVMFRPLHEWFVLCLRGRVRTAAALTTLSILLIVLLPMLWILGRAASETVSLVGQLEQEDLARRFTNLRQRLKIELPSEDLRNKFADIETRLLRVRESLLLASDPAERSEAVLRDVWIRDLVQWSGQLTVELHDQFAPSAEQETDPQQSKRAEAMHASLAAFQGEIQALAKAAGDRQAALEAIVRADAAMDKLRVQVFGTPLVAWLKSQFNFNKEQLDVIPSKLRELAGPLALGTTHLVSSFLLEFLVGLAIMVLGIYYFLADGPAMISAMMRLSPLDDRYEEQLLTEFSAVTRAVILAMLLAAFVQGILSGIGFFFAGFSSIFLLTVLTMLFAMVPFIGAMVIWGSCCVWLFLHDGRPQAALVLAIYCTVIVSLADNLVKPMVLHGRSNLHPLLALLSVLGGAKAMGFIGIVVGPMVVAFLQTLLVMLRSEMLALDVPKTPALGGPPLPPLEGGTGPPAAASVLASVPRPEPTAAHP